MEQRIKDFISSDELMEVKENVKLRAYKDDVDLISSRVLEVENACDKSALKVEVAENIKVLQRLLN